MQSEPAETFYIAISNDIDEQTRRICCTRDYAENLLEQMWLNDEMGYSFYLLDPYGNELCAFEN